MTLGRRELRQLLASHQLEPRRSRGQNFVADANTVRRIARLAGVGPGDRVLEIGAGLGSLTQALAETGAEVLAVEIDPRLVAVLRPMVEPLGVRLIEGDALRLDWQELLGQGASGPAERGVQNSWTLVANLPYNVATPLIADLLDEVPAIKRMLVMVQREAGERLAAGAGDEAYGAVSVKVAYWAMAELVGRVPATVFLPQPNVESVLVRITRREMPAVGMHVDGNDIDPAWLFRLIAAGFGQRRKMLRRSLAGLVSADDFARAGVRPEARAEELDVEAWGRLAACTNVPPPS